MAVDPCRGAMMDEIEESALDLVTDVVRTVEREFYRDLGSEWSAAKQYAIDAARSDPDTEKEALVSELLKSTNDKFTRLVPKSDALRFLQVSDTGAPRGVLGIKLKENDKKQLEVIANKDEIRKGDILVQVEGEIATRASLSGDPGTMARLLLERSSGQRYEIVLQREAPPAPVSTIVAGPNSRMIRLNSFSKATVPALTSLLNEAGDETLVIDLRGNRGGVFEAGLDSAALFLDKSLRLTTIKSRSAPLQVRTTDRPGPFSQKKFSTILLLDQNTASAAELFAAALHYNKNVPLIGTSDASHTYGKARIQRTETLPGGDLLLVSYAVYLTPQSIPQDISGIGLPFDATLDKGECSDSIANGVGNYDEKALTSSNLACLDATIAAAAAAAADAIKV